MWATFTMARTMALARTPAGGRAEVSRYSEGREVGLGAAWSADRQKAWRLVAASAKDGVTKPAAISLDDAASIAKELGLPVPPLAL